MNDIKEQVILSGDRRWLNPRAVLRLIEKHPDALWHIGDCPSGLDEMARCLLIALGRPHVRYLADWDRFGRGAGAIRNHEMVDSALMIGEITGTPVHCYGFHSNIGQSKGTKECLTYAKKKDIASFTIRW